MDTLGFLDSICITVFMSLCDIVGISDRLADHDSISTQRYFQGKQVSRVVTLVLDHAIALIKTSRLKAHSSLPTKPSTGLKTPHSCAVFIRDPLVEMSMNDETGVTNCCRL